MNSEKPNWKPARQERGCQCKCACAGVSGYENTGGGSNGAGAAY